MAFAAAFILFVASVVALGLDSQLALPLVLLSMLVWVCACAHERDTSALRWRLWLWGHKDIDGCPPWCRICDRCSCGHRRYCPIWILKPMRKESS